METMITTSGHGGRGLWAMDLGVLSWENRTVGELADTSCKILTTWQRESMHLLPTLHGLPISLGCNKGTLRLFEILKVFFFF